MPIYVSRTSLTRHGAGPLPGEAAWPEPPAGISDNTNVEHAWQGKLRYAPLDPDTLMQRIRHDVGYNRFMIALTHCDQMKRPYALKPDFMSFGPTREDVAEL